MENSNTFFKMNIKESVINYRDSRLICKSVMRLISLNKNNWIRYGNKFNSWEFPIEFYDLIPKWWTIGSDIHRASKIIRPIRKIITDTFGEKEELRYHNVVNGKMSDSEFEYWWTIRDDNLDGDKFKSYYDKKFKMEELEWWKEEVFNKINL
jgi:hypothetical protein